ncbi:MAG TPA: tetratricopeptide repeat protein [Bryobacteraceae bacterium]|nr:tetratricopeptide repeat protein [Bryobacteraceae bacterium]
MHRPILCILAAGLLAFAQTPPPKKDQLGGRGMTIERTPQKPAEPTKPAGPVSIPKGYALIVGVAKFQNLDPRDFLNYTESDAEAVERVIVSKEGGNIAPENVHALIGSRATLANFRHELEDWLPSVAGPNDRVIVYVASHAFVDQQGHGYLALYDIDARHPVATGYPMERLGDILANKVRSRWKALFTDTCHSAKVTEYTTDKAVNDAYGKLQGFLTLAASHEQERSFEDPDLKHGIFTYYLVQGWKGEADTSPRDGVITAFELTEYVRRNVRDHAWAKHAMQTPQDHGDYSPDMLLGFVPDRAAPAAALRNSTGTLHVVSNMDAVEVYVDGEFRGKLDKGGSASYPGLSAGRHVVRAVRSGYDPDTQEVQIDPGSDSTVNIRIKFPRKTNKQAENLFNDGLKHFIKHHGSLFSSGNTQTDADLKTAEQDFDAALKADPQDAKSAYYLALVEQAMGDTDAAVKHCRQAVDLDPTYVDARVQYGELLVEQGDNQQAVTELLEAARRNDSDALIYSRLAWVYSLTGRYDEALRNADKAVQLAPKLVEARLVRGDTLRLMGRFDQSREDYRAVIDMSIGNSGMRMALWALLPGVSIKSPGQRLLYNDQRNSAFFGMCECEERLGNVQRAAGFCQDALRYEPDDFYTLYLTGTVEMKLYNGMVKTDRAAARAHLVSAEKYLSRVIDINPDHEYSVQARKYVDGIKVRLARLQDSSN